jgi:hypothetical protein
MIVVVPESDVYRSLDILRSSGVTATQVGRVVEGDGRIDIS